MRTDIVLCGVGGQGILSIAAVLDRGAMASGYHVRQPEVHGMAQRGGAVQAFVRISDKPVACDLIPAGSADFVLSVEPMEAMRYLDFLKPDGWVITDITPFINIPDYPEHTKLFETLFNIPRVVAVDAARLAKKSGSQRASNMVMLGASSPLLPFPAEKMEQFITDMFQAKGEAIVANNIKSFRMGRAAGMFFRALVDGGAPPAAVARVVPRIDFEPAPVTDDVVAQWKTFLTRPNAVKAADQIFQEGTVLQPKAVAKLLGEPVPA